MRATIAIQTQPGRTTRHIDWDGTPQTLGRSSSSDIRVELSVVSGHHLTFDTRAGKPVVTDVGSTNGTQLNGEDLPTDEPHVIEQGALITIGSVRIEVSWASPNEDLDDLTAEQEFDSIGDLFEPPESSPASLLASLEVVSNDGSVHVHTLPDDSERLVVGSGDDADLPLPVTQPSAVAAVERTQGGFDLTPLGDLGLLQHIDGRPITDKTQLADGWTGRLQDGPRLIFRDPLESQLQAFESSAADGARSGDTTDPTTTGSGQNRAEAASREAAAPDARTNHADPTARDKLLIAGLLLLLAGVLFLVALFFGLFQ